MAPKPKSGDEKKKETDKKPTPALSLAVPERRKSHRRQKSANSIDVLLSAATDTPRGKRKSASGYHSDTEADTEERRALEVGLDTSAYQFKCQPISHQSQRKRLRIISSYSPQSVSLPILYGNNHTE